MALINGTAAPQTFEVPLFSAYLSIVQRHAAKQFERFSSAYNSEQNILFLEQK